MKGIMLKDLYENFYIKKNLASYIFGALFIGLTSIFIDTKYAFILYTMLLTIAYGSSHWKHLMSRTRKQISISCRSHFR